MFRSINKRLFTSLLVLGVGLATTTLNQSAIAANAGDWQAGNIIDDSIFYSSTDMTIADVQNFLNTKVPTCDTWGTQMYNASMTRAQYGASHGTAAPYICLKDYYENPSTHQNNLNGVIPPGGASAANIIKYAADTYGISARALIVTLQKENTLVTDDWPWPAQYKTAMGYGCPDTAACDSQYYGFYNQVMNAARQFRQYASNSTSYRYQPFKNNSILFNPNTACGSSQVYIQNFATAGLYNYTPYQPNQAALANLYGAGDGCSAYGNRNFWRLFTDWFGNTHGTFLVQSPQSPTVYLISNNTRYAIPSGDTLWAYGFQNVPVTPTSDIYVNSLANGGTLNTLFKKEGDTTVYLADNGYKIGIASNSLCQAWGFGDCTSSQIVKVLSAPLANRLLSGPNLNYTSLNGSVIALMQNGQKRVFLSNQAATERGYDPAQSTPITNPLNYRQPYWISLPQNNSFVYTKAIGSISMFTNDNYYDLANWPAYKGWFPANAMLFNDIYSPTKPSPSAIVDQFVFISSGQKYVLDGGTKVEVTQVSSDFPDQQNVDNLQVFLNNLPSKPSATSRSTYRNTGNGLIYRVTNKQLKAFNSLKDYFGLNYTADDIIPMTTETTQRFAVGSPLFAPGYLSLIKVSGSDALYTVGLNNVACSLNNIDQLKQFNLGNSSTTLDQTSAAQFTFNQQLWSLVSSSDNNLFLIDRMGGIKYSVSQAIASAWGVANSPTCGVTSKYLDSFSFSNPSSLGKFGRDPQTGIIYYADDGTRHPISSYDKFVALGGNANNTLNLAADFLAHSPIGSTY